MLEIVSTIFQFLVQRPLIMLMLMALPLLVAARIKQVYPTRMMLGVFTLLAAMSVLITFFPILLYGILFLDAVFLLVILVDFFTVVGVRKLSASRNTLKIASLGKPHDIEIELVNRSRQSVTVTVKDDLPDCFKATPASFDTVITPQSRAIFDLSLIHI